MLKQFSRLCLVQMLLILPGFSQSKISTDFKPSMTFRSGVAYSLGKQANASVSPSFAFGFNFDLQKNIFPVLEGGANFRYDNVSQYIRSNSSYGDVSYQRTLHFLSFGGVLHYCPTDKKIKTSVAFGLRALVGGRMIRKNYFQNGQDLSREEVNLEPFRKYTPFIQTGFYYQIHSQQRAKYYAGALAGFSLASTDFKYQSSTINSFELCLRIAR